MQAPVFIIGIEESSYSRTSYSDDGRHLILNPKLESIYFEKCKDAKSCYQEIFQFLADGPIKRDPTETPMSKLDKVNQHGFDPTYGFRKRPGRKKRRKKGQKN